jgi:serine/threonine protein phosphatase PrpC
MNYAWATVSDVGHVREGNEDSVAPLEDGIGNGPLLIVVADGMGGHVGGEIASRLATDAALTPATGADVPVRARVTMANEAVIAAVAADPSLTGMGTTMTLGLFDADGLLHIGHVGDSRLYLFRDGDLKLVTRDHTWVMDMLLAGRLAEGQAAGHPRRHLLTRVLGMTDVEVDEDEIQLQDGDRILACSDGLTTMLTDHRIRDLIAESATPSEAAWALVEAANAAGGYDNTTVVVVDAGS